MRHRRRGRKLGRNPKHQRALLRNLASSLFLTERNAEFDKNAPGVPGRIVTTLAKAKEVRPLVEKCITIARRTLPAQQEADRLEPQTERGSQEWNDWRSGDGWQEWNQAAAKVVAARRRVLRLLGDKEAMRICFDEIAPRFEVRHGGYTRILRLAQPRLGDAGTRAILEFVGVRDRVVARSERPAFDEGDEGDRGPDQATATDEALASADDQAGEPTGEPTDQAAAEGKSQPTEDEKQAAGEEGAVPQDDMDETQKQ